MGLAEFEDNDVPIRSAVIERAERVSTEDEQDLPILARVLVDIQAAKDAANSVLSIDLVHPNLSAEAQILAHQFALETLIEPLESAILSTIGEVRLKQLSNKRSK